MLNNITIMGRMTRDPELRYTQSKTAVASFTVAVERDFSTGEQKVTDFIDCVAWGKTGEVVSNHFAKGSMICLAGSLQLRDWQDKDGNKRRSAEVNARNVYFCGAKAKDGQALKGVDVQYTEVTNEEDGELPF